MIEIDVPDEWDMKTSGLEETPCKITGDCHVVGSSIADDNSLVHAPKTRRSRGMTRSFYVSNSTGSTLTNISFITTAQVKFTYEINVPYNSSILQQMPRLNEELESFLNMSFVEASIEVVYMTSFLGASTTRCIPKDGLRTCALASSNLIIAHNGNNTASFKKVDFDAKSGESVAVSFPLSSQQVQFIILHRFYFYMKKRKDDTAEVSLLTPVPTSTNLILQFKSNSNQTITTMSQQDIEWLEMCATNFIQQYITNSGIISSIIPPTTFALVSNKTEYPGDWRYDFPAIGSEVESKNSSSSNKTLYVNLFVAGQYNALLQNKSDFDIAVKKLFQDKNDLLLQILRWSNMNNYDGHTSTKTTSSFFYDTQSVKLINPASEVKASTSIYEKPHLSKSTTVVWFSFSAFCAASLLILLLTLNSKIRAVTKNRKKMLVDPEKKVGNDTCPLDKHDEPVSTNHDLEQTFSEEEKLPLSPKQEAESPKNKIWSFSEAIRNNSSSKIPRSPRPAKDIMASDPTLFSRQSSFNGSSNVRKRLSMSGLDNVQLLPVLKMDFSPGASDLDM